MAYCFGDSFDLYAAPADAIAGYWDSGNAGNYTFGAPGRFGGRCVATSSTGAYLVKSSGSNDAVHHIVCAVSTVALSGTFLGIYLQLSDGATNQVCIVFRSDGAILLTSATPVGTVLATYTGAVTLTNQWFAFEFEVVIHPTAGRFRVRKNNNTSDDFDSGATLNTRPGTNSYANKLTLGMQAFSPGNPSLDDLLWRSDASSVPFVGDIRTYVRMPVSDAGVVFSRTGTGAVAQTVPLSAGANISIGSTTARFTPITANYSGTVTSVSVAASVGNAGNMKCAIYNDNANAPGTVLASATAPITPVAVGTSVFTFAGATIVKDVQYWIAIMCDTATGTWSGQSSGGIYAATATASYATFPQANPVATVSTSVQPVQFSWTYNTTPGNWQAVSEAQQDGVTSYVYSSNVGDTDLYNVASIGVTPASTVAVTTRTFVSKSDAGSRSGKVLLKSGGTTVDSGSATLATTWMNMWRTDTLDPATGAAWTPTGVNLARIGVQCTA